MFEDLIEKSDEEKLDKKITKIVKETKREVLEAINQKKIDDFNKKYIGGVKCRNLKI